MDAQELKQQIGILATEAEQLGGAAFEAGASIDDNPFTFENSPDDYEEAYEVLEQAWNAGWDYAQGADELAKARED